MDFFRQAFIWWPRFRDALLVSLARVNGIELPEEGRSSVETTGTLAGHISGALDIFGTVSPVIDFDMLRLLKTFWLTNPDLSQYVANVVHLGNPGHQIVIDAPSTTVAEGALTRINEAASRIYQHGAGVDGLINALLAQVAWSGALSSEDVVDLGKRRVEQSVLVPVEQIRFRFLEGQYVPFQHPTSFLGLATSLLGGIRLNPETYRYYAVQTIENSPYAKPPASAAVGAIAGPQTSMVENLDYIMNKLGLFGLVSVACTPPPKQPNEDLSAYNGRAQKYLASVRKVLQANFKKGLLVHFRDQQMLHTNVASDARGAKDVWQINEEQVMSGLGMQPAFFGRTDSTTETYANVVYQLLLALVGNIQRLPKRRVEATYRLDCRLGGLAIDAVSVQFNKAYARDPLKEAQAEEALVRTVILKAEKGILSPDDAARELGYDSAFDPSLLSQAPQLANSLRALTRSNGASATFRFDVAAQRYRLVPARLELANDAERKVLPLKKKAA